MVTALLVALPVQLCGPLRVILPAVSTLPMKASNGASKDSAHSVSVTLKVEPTSDGSQCAVTFQSPLTSGQLALPPLPASPWAPGESEELEPHALHSTTTTNRLRIIPRGYRRASLFSNNADARLKCRKCVPTGEREHNVSDRALRDL